VLGVDSASGTDYQLGYRQRGRKEGQRERGRGREGGGQWEGQGRKEEKGKKIMAGNREGAIKSTI